MISVKNNNTRLVFRYEISVLFHAPDDGANYIESTMVAVTCEKDVGLEIYRFNVVFMLSLHLV